ncbi:unnamed protein product, partial [Symbiodinium microadriaticum]
DLMQVLMTQNQALASQNSNLQQRIDKLEDERASSQPAWRSATSGGGTQGSAGQRIIEEQVRQREGPRHESFGAFGQDVGDERDPWEGQDVLNLPYQQGRDPFNPGDRTFWNLPTLEGLHAPSPATRAGDWLAQIRPLLCDLSEWSQLWWARVEWEAQTLYRQWSRVPSIEKGMIQPRMSIELMHVRFRRLESRAYGMLQSAVPQTIRDELLATRSLHCVGLLFQILKVYAPGGLQERAQVLNELTNLGTAKGAADIVAALRTWSRGYARAANMGVNIPDPALLSSARNRLEIDHRPSMATVIEYMRVLQSEWEQISVSGQEAGPSGKGSEKGAREQNNSKGVSAESLEDFQSVWGRETDLINWLRESFGDWPEHLLQKALPVRCEGVPEGAQSFLALNRRSRRAIDKADSVILHLSSGKDSGFKLEGEGSKVVVVRIDEKIGRDLLNEQSYAWLATLCSSGKVSAVVAHPPSETFKRVWGAVGEGQGPWVKGRDHAMSAPARFILVASLGVPLLRDGHPAPLSDEAQREKEEEKREGRECESELEPVQGEAVVHEDDGGGIGEWVLEDECGEEGDEEDELSEEEYRKLQEAQENEWREKEKDLKQPVELHELMFAEPLSSKKAPEVLRGIQRIYAKIRMLNLDVRRTHSDGGESYTLEQSEKCAERLLEKEGLISRDAVDVLLE